MRITPPWIALLQLASFDIASAVAPVLRPRDYDSREYYAVQLSSAIAPESLARDFGFEFEGRLGELDDHYLFSGPLGDTDVIENYLRRRKSKRSLWDVEERNEDQIIFWEKQKLKKLEKRIVPPNRRRATTLPQKRNRSLVKQLEKVARKLRIEDPIFSEQWHLLNTVQRGHDVNVTGVWLEGITGYNVTVAIVDDGLDMYSDDLRDNYFAAGSYDFNDQSPEPKPRLSDDRHGTRCAGEIAAVRNDVCGVGVAYDAKVAGIRILSKQISDADEAIALNYHYQENYIYSCSWGPPDDGRSMDAPGILIKKAILKGINEGRRGLGSVFVFASGNGAANDDNCNFDGYTNSIYSITVGAIDREGNHPYYSEHCSAQMGVTYSSGSGDAIHTTDVGTNQCYSGHGGTSAAAPLAAGIFALVLSARPDLSWRDLQYLTMQTTVPVNEYDGNWHTTAAGRPFSHRYGYGKLDAYAIVEAAKTFKSVKPQSWYKSPVHKVNRAIPEGNLGLKSDIKITKQQLQDANFERVEHVQVRMNARHGRRGDMSVDLISPRGFTSHIATERRHDMSTVGYKDWDFMTVAHWGEDGSGIWSVIIRDKQDNEYNGSFIDWSITLWGEAIDAEKAELHPLPGDESKTLVNHPQPTRTASAVITSLSRTRTSNTHATGNPSDHIDRPVNTKPTPSVEQGTIEAPPEEDKEGSEEEDMNGSKEGDMDGSKEGDMDGSKEEGVGGSKEEDTDGSKGGAKTGYLPSFLPTFGVSAKTQLWIYGAFVVIVAFIAAIAVYLVKQRRKQKARKDDMEYEFEPLNSEDIEGGAPQGQAPRGAAGGRRKARDLYDAFGASDDEAELFSDDGDDDKEYYDDEEARGIDEGPREGDREKLLSRGKRE